MEDDPFDAVGERHPRSDDPRPRLGCKHSLNGGPCRGGRDFSGDLAEDLL